MKKTIILLIFAALVMGIIDGGDITAAVVMAIILTPSIRQGSRKRSRWRSFLGKRSNRIKGDCPSSVRAER